MAICANCSRALQPGWKFCIYCGNPTVGSAATAPVATTPTNQHTAGAMTEPTPEPTPEPVPEVMSPVLRAEDIPPDEPDPTPAAIRPAGTAAAHVNILAVLALILGCLVSPLAALFGHLALSQISRSGERGTAIAWVAIVLGYLSLAAVLVLGISYLVLNA
jgi:hypothetical protein